MGERWASPAHCSPGSFIDRLRHRAAAGFALEARPEPRAPPRNVPTVAPPDMQTEEDRHKVHPRNSVTPARWALGAMFAGLVGLAAPPALAEDPPPYEGHIQCETPGDARTCRIDLWMTRGYRAFSQCQVCHGLDGSGSTIGPSLLDKMQEIDRARFMEVVADGMQGQIGVMPGWKENPNVMRYVDQLYAYLMARSDKVLPGGKVKRYDR